MGKFNSKPEGKLRVILDFGAELDRSRVLNSGTVSVPVRDWFTPWLVRL